MRYRPPNWAERVLLVHGDRMARWDEHWAARHQHEVSLRWWAERRHQEALAAQARFLTTEPGSTAAYAAALSLAAPRP